MNEKLKEENNYIKYFKTEKNIILKSHPDYIIHHAIESCDEEIKGILEKIDDGWSGMSAGYYIRAFSDMFKKILSFKPLSPLTFQDDEWNETYGFEDIKHYQNKRMYSIFKEVTPDGKVEISDVNAVCHCSPYIYDVATDKYTLNEYGDLTWSGPISIFIPEEDRFIIMNTPEVINMKDFIGDNQDLKIKTIEVIDSVNKHSDFEFHLTIKDAIPKDFYKDYKIKSIHQKEWVVNQLKIINTPKWKEFIKQHATDLL